MTHYLFHQNMKTFGGSSDNRNNAFTTAFEQANSAYGNAFAAAGFTELGSGSPTMAKTIIHLAKTLDKHMDRLALVEVGRMAVSGESEWIGISWVSSRFTVSEIGLAVRPDGGQAGEWRVKPVAVAGAGAGPVYTVPLDYDTHSDHRGIAWIAGTYKGAPRIWGFMHNMYGEGNRSGDYADVPKVMLSLTQNVGGAGRPYANAEIIVGGDFNVKPHLDGKHNPPRHALEVDEIYCVDTFGRPRNTTKSNPYDFWCVRHGFDYSLKSAVLRYEALEYDASDHGAIMLQLR